MAAVDRGVCIWLTGLSGAGKSTIAEALVGALREADHTVALIDGDALRRGPSAGLGFSKRDRDVNVLRAADMAREGVARGEIVVCALISPYRDTRDAARRLLGVGNFIEVFVNASLEVCEARDPKGLYGRYRRGEISGISGIDDPYESPLTAELVLDTESRTVDDSVTTILTYLTGWREGSST